MIDASNVYLIGTNVTVVIQQATDSPQFFPSMISVVAAIETLLAVVVARSGNEAVSSIAGFSKMRQSRSNAN